MGEATGAGTGTGMGTGARGWCAGLICAACASDERPERARSVKSVRDTISRNPLNVEGA